MTPAGVKRQFLLLLLLIIVHTILIHACCIQHVKMSYYPAEHAQQQKKHGNFQISPPGKEKGQEY